MPLIFDGGVPTTKLLGVTSTAEIVAPMRNGGDNGVRSVVTIQNVGTVVVYLGGPDVKAGGDAKQGLALSPVSDITTTQPHAASFATSVHPLYAIVDSSAGSIVVYEEVYKP